MLYRIETGTLGIYDVDNIMEAAKVLRWILNRFRIENPDPMGYLIVKKNGTTIFSASHDVPSVNLPDDADKMIRKGIEQIGWRYATLGLLASYVISAEYLNSNAVQNPAEYLEDLGLVCWTDSTAPGYMQVGTPIQYQAYLGQYGVGIKQHYRYDNSSRFHGVRYWIRPDWTIRNPYIPEPESSEEAE